MNHFDKTKHKSFPEIKDFTDPQDKLRNKPGYKHSTADWFWFNPFAFRYISISLPTCFLFGSSFIFGMCYIKGWGIFGIINILIFIVSAVKLVQALRKRRWWKKSNMNFYDQFLREYPMGRGVPKK